MRDTRLGSGELFPTDLPVPVERMFGRDADIDAIAAQLSGGANIVLAGPRRTGKTSVADAAVAACAGAGHATAALDLFRYAGLADLAEALAIAILANRPPLRRALTAASRNARQLRDALTATATLRAREDIGEELELALSISGQPAGPEQRFQAALDLLEPVAAGSGRLVLFLDEFQDISSGRFGDPDGVTRQIRATLQRSPRVSTLFAGSIAHLMRDLFAPSDRALSQFGSFHELTEISVKQWRDGLRARFAEGGCEISDDALQLLIEAGEQHPRATMLIAQQTHQAATLELESAIDGALVRVGLGRALSAEHLKHDQTLERIRSLGRGRGRGSYQVIAQRVARGAPLYEDFAPQTANRALGALRDAGVLERTGAGWRIGDPLLRRYLAGL